MDLYTEWLNLERLKQQYKNKWYDWLDQGTTEWFIVPITEANKQYKIGDEINIYDNRRSGRAFKVKEIKYFDSYSKAYSELGDSMYPNKEIPLNIMKIFSSKWGFGKVVAVKV